MFRNIYSEKSKADDVQFILDLIAKVGAEIPAADMENVNIAGTSNGAALTYQILINTGADRPFRRSVGLVVVVKLAVVVVVMMIVMMVVVVVMMVMMVMMVVVNRVWC